MPKQEQAIQTTIEGTMVTPLWARATYSQLYPEILNDRQAIALIEQVKTDYPEATAEFAVLEKLVDELMGLNFLIRAKMFDNAVTNFIESHPEATIVNLGCGLDTTFSRVDNGKIKWYDLDLPEAIEYRKKLIPESSRSKCLAKDVFDLSWFNDIDFDVEKGIFLFAAGLFNYFQEEKIADLCSAMAERFPNGELMFDIPSSLGNRIMNRRLKKLGVTGITFYFGLNNPGRQITKWSEKIQLINWFSLFSKVVRNKKWKLYTRLQMNISDIFKIGKYVHLRFKKY
ncbi:MAG: class I SAM-dependent methyltransferase [Promethearchaeota archaeon]